jgi:CubicO group peptidase (beta-lactamase class C family)
MDHTVRRSLSLLFLSVAFAQARPPADVQQRLEALVAPGSGGAAVAWVDRDGVALFAAGRMDGPDSAAVTPDTRFELGSVTKVFTSLLLAESELRGKVKRLDPAARFLLPPESAEQAALAKITLVSLSTHTSGLPRLPANIGISPDTQPDPYATYDHTKLLEALRVHGAVAVVGREVAYSNFGVAVLGAALGQAWGQGYASALGNHVLTPLGLASMRLGLAGETDPADLALGHGAQAARRPAAWKFDAFAPAGALQGTARELGKFLSFCLSPEGSPLALALAATLQPQRRVEAMGGWIGLGWFLTDDSARALAWHNGATAGSRAFVAFDRAAGVGVAVVTNRAVVIDPFGFRLIGRQPPRPSSAVIKDAADFVGRYPLAPEFVLEITAAEGVLHLQATGQSRLVLRRREGDSFSVTGLPAEVTFERDSKGAVVAAVLHQNGRAMRGARQDAAPARPEIALPVETLRQYVGRYPLTPEFVLTVSVADGQLQVQASGQPRFPVFASGPDSFFYKVVDAGLTFERDAAGAVVSVVLHQGGRDQRAPRSKAE